MELSQLPDKTPVWYSAYLSVDKNKHLILMEL